MFFLLCVFASCLIFMVALKTYMTRDTKIHFQGIQRGLIMYNLCVTTGKGSVNCFMRGTEYMKKTNILFLSFIYLFLIIEYQSSYLK